MNDRIWRESRGRLTTVLEDSVLWSDEAFEALRFCYQLWVTLYPDGELEPDVATTLLAAIETLVRELLCVEFHNMDGQWQPMPAPYRESMRKRPESRDFWPADYLDWMLYDASRLIRYISSLGRSG